MADALSKTQLFSGSFNNIFGIINEEKANYDVSIQNMMAEFSERRVKETSDYPVVIVSRAESIGADMVSRDVRIIPMSLDIVIEATKAKHLDSLSNDIFNTLMSNESKFSNNGIFNINVTSVSNDDFMRGKIKVHQRIITVEFDFDYQVS